MGMAALETERLRIEDILRLLPRGRTSLLDVGARDGRISVLASEVFPLVVGLDLRPAVSHPRVQIVAGDATKLPFRDGAFDCVLCTEVLEHIPAIRAACEEIARVARREVVIGVPYRQDLRVGRTKCGLCGKRNPPYGHLHCFDLWKLMALFPGLKLMRLSYVGATREISNPVSRLLMDLAGNPYGTYDQKETCLYCGSALFPPSRITLAQRTLAGVALRLERAQQACARDRPIWIHAVFLKS